MTCLYDNAMEYFAYEIERIDVLGPNRRLIFTMPSLESTESRNVVVKVIVSAELLSKLSYMAAGAVPATISPELLALETTTAN